MPQPLYKPAPPSTIGRLEQAGISSFHPPAASSGRSQDDAPDRSPHRHHSHQAAPSLLPGMPAAPGLSDDAKPALLAELTATCAQLLAMVTELETENEALKSSNEAYQAANEDLQATNRALETARQEMQSVNDQLRTINAELTARDQALERRMAERTAALEAASLALTQQTEERRRTEEMLRQSQKLEAIGKLTGGIAHDFNNLLGVIIGNAEILLDTLEDQPEEADQAREILDSALGGAELTRRLLAFARKQPLQPRRIDLNALLQGQVAMLRRILGEAIHVGASLAPDLWTISADASQIGDALLNLALNARDAMPQGGDLTITTANAHLKATDADNGQETLTGDFVVLAVKDTGIGMPLEVMSQATEPFFSTKPPGAGSGLGLSMIYGFARQSGGQLLIDSRVGVGTTVRLYLPRSHADAVDRPAAASGTVAQPGGNEVILVVDDNSTLNDLAQRHLAALGYGVKVAGNGPAALALLASGTRFDLLFTDVVMPDGMSGYALAEAAQRLQPHLRLLFTSGYAGEAGYADHGARPTLHKPYRRQELAETVRAVLDAPR
jgi:signal transduction histidine kinase